MLPLSPSLFQRFSTLLHNFQSDRRQRNLLAAAGNLIMRLPGPNQTWKPQENPRASLLGTPTRPHTHTHIHTFHTCS